MITLETDRLRLRPFREEDLDPYARTCADPEVMRYIGTGQTLSRTDAWRQMAFFLGHWELRGYGMWAAELKETGTCIGRIGLHRPEAWPGLEVGWLLDRASWGHGLATEGAQEALDDAFTRLGADHVISVICPDNARSIRVAERLGERFERWSIVNGIEVAVYGTDRPGRRGPVDAGGTYA
jgi:RimJ/RimL family protein N-acetyltransferase